jgi:hypothetical protein
MTPRKRKPRAKSTRKPGGQPGNKNNLRHGFYAKSFTPDENKRLDNQGALDVLGEINLIRVSLDKLTAQISFDEITRTDNNGTEFRDAHYLNQLNTLSNMTGAIATLVRTHYLTHGKSGDLQSSILTALEELRLEMGL